MNLLEAIILGIVQGITEFLPVSSSGHLALAQHLFRVEEPAMTFDVMLHVGTLVPVFIVFWRDIAGLALHPVKNLKTWLMLIAGTLPAVLAALFFADFVEGMFTVVWPLGIGFMITGIALWFADTAKPGKRTEETASLWDGLAVGLAQAVAITPSISRSGSTVAAGLLCGMTREAAARFSFLLSIPAVGGAAFLQVVKLLRHGGEAALGIPVAYMLVGALAAGLAGYLSIRFMLEVIKRAKLRYFGVYVLLLAAFIFVDTFILNGAVFGA